MPQQELHASSRLGIVAACELLVLYFLHGWWIFGAHYVGHSYLPGHNFLVEGVASAVCLVLAFPVLQRGHRLQKTVACALSLMPAILLVLAVYYIIRINMYASGLTSGV